METHASTRETFTKKGLRVVMGWSVRSPGESVEPVRFCACAAEPVFTGDLYVEAFG